MQAEITTVWFGCNWAHYAIQDPVFPKINFKTIPPIYVSLSFFFFSSYSRCFNPMSLCLHQSIYLANLMNYAQCKANFFFRECGSHGDHYIGSAWPSALNINRAWLTDTERVNACAEHIDSVWSKLFYRYVTEFYLLPSHESSSFRCSIVPDIQVTPVYLEQGLQLPL